MSGGTSRNWSKWRRNHAWKYRKSNFESLSHGVDERKAKRNFGTTVLSVINSKLQAFRGPVASVVLNSPEDYEVLKKGNYKPSHHVVCGILYGRADQQPTVDLIPPYKISYCEPPHFYERMFWDGFIKATPCLFGHRYEIEILRTLGTSKKGLEWYVEDFIYQLFCYHNLVDREKTSKRKLLSSWPIGVTILPYKTLQFKETM